MIKSTRILFCLCSVLGWLPLISTAADQPLKIVLVGDSTVAPNGGWGPVFSQFLADGAICTNLARAGRSSKSYLAEGVWEKALAAKGDYYLIQFGHNDQLGKGPDRETDPATTYTANLTRMVDEARAISATPVLITSLTRRKFSTNEPVRIMDSLGPYAEAVKMLAAKKQVPLIDLHARSIAWCENLGPEGTAAFNRTGKDGSPDTTHLSDAGGMAFARLVVEDLRRAVPALDSVLLAEPRAESAKIRVFVLTDIENEPDDAMSMVRFLTYCNQWDVEGLVATTSVHQNNKTAAWRIREIIAAYGQVRDNLLIHEAGYPTTNALLSVLKEGLPLYGMNAVGAGHDSPGSELLIKAVGKDDPRPVWVTVWGGPNVLAQALWKVRATRTPEELEKFVSKLRVYTVSDQDDSGPWIRKNFTNLFYIASPGFHSLGGYHHATWTGISGDNFHGRFVGADTNIVSNPWLDEHIRSKGPLGKQYPFMKFLMEGDTPTFLYLINNGLGNPEHPDWGSWGGRYEFYTPPFRKWHIETETRAFWADAEDEVLGVDGKWHTGNKETIWRWRTAYQNDFEARMNWSITTNYAGANHPPVTKLKHTSEIIAKPGDVIQLSAEGSTDPDGNALSYRWIYYPEPGTFTLSTARTGVPLKIENFDQMNASFTVPPKFGKAGAMHIILAVTDNGTPALTRYQRVIVEVKP